MADRLSRYCAEYQPTDGPSALDEETFEKLRRHLLDWIGLVIGGREHGANADSVLGAVDGLDDTPDRSTERDRSPGVPIGRSMSTDRAALLSGTFAHSLDFDDTHRASSLHPGAPVIAAALPVAREIGSTGGDLLEAISIGYDVACGIGRALGPDAHYARGFHLTATCGTFGATAAIGALRGFDADEFESAFGINGSQAAGSLQFLENGSWNKRLHPGLAASRALLAGELAGRQFRGSADPIEGTFGFLNGYSDDPNPALLDEIEPGRAIRETGLKPYPCCRYMHAAIDGLLAIGETVDPDTVEAIEIDLPSPGVRLTGDPIDRKRRPKNFVDCQFSAPFAAALSLSTGDAGLSAFLDAQDRLDDPELRTLMNRVTVVSTDRTNDPFPEQWTANVLVEADSEYERFVEHPRGEPEKPMSWEAIETKFHELVESAGMDRSRASEIVDAVQALGEEETAVTELFEAI